MWQYFLTLAIYSIALFIIPLAVYFKRIPNVIIPLLNFTLWYTVLNFANVFPWLSIGNMNWTGKLLVAFIIAVLILCYSISRKKGFIYFEFNQQNKKIITITAVIYVVFIVGALISLLIFKRFNWERFVMNAIVVGISEELCFRGFLYQKLLKLNKTADKEIWKTIIICSMAFGITHISPFNDTLVNSFIFFTIPFVGGIIFNIVYLKTKNLLIPILIHNLFDTLEWTVSILLFGVNRLI
jgi:membrane protease YdiL (CAAX protease family)